MKKILLCAALAFFLVACENSGKTAAKADSIKVSLDTTINRIKDSIEAKGNRTLDSINQKIKDLKSSRDQQKDTLR